MAESTTVQIQTLLDRFVAGDAAAKADLVRVAEDRLMVLTRRLLQGFPRARDHDDTTGIFSEAYLRMHAALDELKPTTVRQFLGLAALEIRRVLLDLVRKVSGRGKTRRPGKVSLDGGGDGGPGFDPAAAGADAHIDLATDLFEAIDRLPDELREIVMLLYFQGLSQAEAGAVLGVHEDTVKRKWSKARVILADRLEAFDPAAD